MPCNSDYMNATPTERKMSQVACFMDEINGVNDSHACMEGYHPRVYGQNLNKNQQDEMVVRLCTKCRVIDISNYSLELQIWWRDHKRADELRNQTDAVAEQRQIDTVTALAKLTDRDIEVLGLRK